MSHAAVENIFNNLLESQFPTLPRVEIINNFPQDDIPVDDNNFPQNFISTIFIGTAVPIGLGNDTCFRENGTITVVFFAPSGSGKPNVEMQSVKDYFLANREIAFTAPLTGFYIRTVADGIGLSPMRPSTTLGNYWTESLVLTYQAGFIPER